MKEKIILNQKIIAAVKSKCSSGGVGCSYPKLLTKLLSFVNDNKNLVGNELYTEYSKASSFGDDKKLRLALSRKNGDQDIGATTGLRNLLCFYAFGKDYEATLREELHTTLEAEIAADEKIKGERPSLDAKLHDGFNSLKSALGSVNENIEQRFKLMSELLEYNQRAKTQRDEFSEANKKYFHYLEEGQHEKTREPLEIITRNLHQKIEEERLILGFFASELLHDMVTKEQFEEAIEMSSRLQQIIPNQIEINQYTAYALYQCKRYQDALTYLEKNLSLIPFEAENIQLQILSYIGLDNYEKAVEITENALQLFKEGKLKRVQTTLSFTSFTQIARELPVDEDYYISLLCYHAHALIKYDTSDSRTLPAINAYLDLEDDLFFSKMKVVLLRKHPEEYMRFLEQCLKKYPNEYYFHLNHIAVQVQAHVKRKTILRNVAHLLELNNTEAKDQLLSDPVFKPLWDDLDFQKIVNREKGDSSFWKLW